MISNMKKKLITAILFFYTALLFSNNWNIYIDADFTGAKESSEAIKKGVELALDRYLPEEMQVNIIVKNHRGNAKRSLSHLKEFYKDPKGLVIFCGLHSPPVLANLNYINNKKIVLLDPWAAATPITRTPDKNDINWVFRLSVDDSQAGEVITSNAVDKEGFKKPLLLLEDTGWGKANEITFKKAIKMRGLAAPQVLWFDWQLGDIGAKQIMSDIIAYKPDVIFLVANAIEGETLLKEITRSKARIPVRSHWGITGGSLCVKCQDELKSDNLNLEFIQTSFLFTNKKLTKYQKDTWNLLKQKYPSITSYKNLKAPLGFIHAYDLTKILISTLTNIKSDKNIEEQREQLRTELENITSPINGLIKTYRQPFDGNKGAFSHEALYKEDFKMGYFNKKGEIVLKD